MKDVIHNINDGIIALLQEANQRADVKAYGLAESVAVRSEEDVTFPAIVLPSSECIDVYGETDKHDVVLYHRLGDISYNEETNASYGSGRTYARVADVSLLVFGKREVFSQYQVEKIVTKTIAGNAACTLVRSDFNALQIFASEYVGVTYFMGSAYYLFKINYRITSTYDPRCK